MTDNDPQAPIPGALGSSGRLSFESAQRVLPALTSPQSFNNILAESLPALVRSFTQCSKGTAAQSISDTIESLLAIPPGAGTDLFGSSGPALRVTPKSDFLVSGIVGASFTGTVATYTVWNDGGDPLPWTATVQNNSSWISLSDGSGILQVGESQTITVTLDQTTLLGFDVGSYTDTLLFVNTIDGVGNTSRDIVITVSDSSTAPPSDLSYPTLGTTYVVQTDIGEHYPSVTGAVDFYLVSPELPDGVNLSPLTGRVSGLAVTVQSPTIHTFLAVNAAGSAQLPKVLGITLPPSESPPTSIRYSPDPLVVEQLRPISTVTPIIDGGIPTNYLSNPTMPLGVNLNSILGFIDGVPLQLGTTVHNIVGSNTGGAVDYNLTITVVEEGLDSITYSPDTYIFLQGVAISPITPTVVGGNVASFSVSPDPFPLIGVSFNTGTGAFSGAPTVSILATPFTVTAANPTRPATTVVTFSVSEGSPSNLQYTPNPAILTAGVATQILPSNAGGQITSYSVSPVLPSNLTLDLVTGIVTGTPATEGSSSHLVVGLNVSGSTSTTLNIITNPSPPTGLAYSPDSIKITVGQSLAAITPTLVSGTSVTYSISPPLPSGGVFSPASGRISGTFDSSAVQPNTLHLVTVENVSGSNTDTLQIEVDPRSPGSLIYSPNPLQVYVNQPVSVFPSISPADSVTFSAATLPLGLGVDSDDGELVGIPLVADSDSSPETGSSPESGDTVAEFLINTASINYFTARATLPLPLGYTWERDKCPLTMYDPQSSPMDTQWEPVSYYPNGDVAVVELLGLAYRGDNRYPGNSQQTFTARYESPSASGSPDTHFIVDRFVGSPGSAYVRTYDVFGNEYRANVIPSPDKVEEYRLGPVYRTAYHHAPLRPVSPSATTLSNMGGIHVYLNMQPNVVALGLDLLWHSGMIGSPGDPKAEVEWDLFFTKLQLVVKNSQDDWNLVSSRPEPFLSAKTVDGSDNIYDLIRPMTDGTIHVLPQTRQREFRLSLYTDSNIGQGLSFTDHRGWGTVRPSNYSGRRGWSWYNGDCAGYGPNFQRLPELGYLTGLAGLWAGYRDTSYSDISGMRDLSLSGQVSMSNTDYKIDQIDKVSPGTVVNTIEGAFTFTDGGVAVTLSDEGSSLTNLPAHWRAGKVPFIDDLATSATTQVRLGSDLGWIQGWLDNPSAQLVTVDGVNKVYFNWNDTNFGDIAAGADTLTLDAGDDWDLKLPFANSNGIEWPYSVSGGAYGGQTGGTGIDPYFGIDGIWLGSREALLYVNTLASGYTHRQRGAYYKESGSPFRIDEYVPSGAFPWDQAASSGVWNRDGGTPTYDKFRDSPFGFISSSDKSHETEVATQRLSPCYHLTWTKLNFDPIHGQTDGYDPIDYQHFIRITRTHEWSVYMSNDPINKRNLDWLAENGRMYSGERVGERLASVVDYSPQNFGSTGLGRADGWIWQAAAAEYTLKSPDSDRSRWSPWFRSTNDAMTNTRTPNGAWSVFNTGRVIDNDDFNSQYSVGQQIEHCYLMNGLRCVESSVFSGVSALASPSAQAIENVTQGGSNLWNFQWVWKSPNDPLYPAPDANIPWAYIAFRDGLSSDGTLFNTHAEHPSEQYTATRDGFPTPIGLGNWLFYSPDSTDVDSALTTYSNGVDPLTDLQNRARSNLTNYAGIIGTLQERLSSGGSGGFSAPSPTVYPITATNEAGESTFDFSIFVSDGSPTSLSYAPDPAKPAAGVDFVVTPIVTGGFPDTWTVSPSPFSGMVFDTLTGVFSGNVPTSQPNTTFAVDGSNPFGLVSATVDIEVLASPISPPSNFRYSPPGPYTLIRDKGPVTFDAQFDGDVPFVGGSIVISPELPNVQLSSSVFTVTSPYDIAGGEVVSPITGSSPIPYHPPEKTALNSKEALHIYLPRGTAPPEGWDVVLVNSAGSYVGVNPKSTLNPGSATDRFLIAALNSGSAVVSFGTVSSGFGDGLNLFGSPNTTRWTDWNYSMPEKGPLMAVQWTKLYGSTYGLNPKKIRMAGASAGSLINAYSTLGPDRAFSTGSAQVRQSTRVSGFINLIGITDFTAYDSPFTAGMQHFESQTTPGTGAASLADASTADLRSVSLASLIAHPESNAPFTPILSIYDEPIGSTDYSQVTETGYPGLSSTLLANVHDLWNGGMLSIMLDQLNSPTHSLNSEFWHQSPVGALGAASPFVTGTFSGNFLSSPVDTIIANWLTAQLALSPFDPDGLRLHPKSGQVLGVPTLVESVSTRTLSVENPSGTTAGSLTLSVEIPSPDSLSYPSPNPIWTFGEAIPPQSPTWSAEGTAIFTVSPPFPDNVTLNSLTGRVEGVVNEVEAGISRKIFLSNSTGTISTDFLLTVTGNPPQLISYSPNPAVYLEGASVLISPLVIGGVDSWLINPPIPADRDYTFDAVTGLFGGVASPDGVFIHDVTAVNQFGASAPLSVTLNISNTDPIVLDPDASFSYTPTETTAPNGYTWANVWIPVTAAPPGGYPAVVEFRSNDFGDASPRAQLFSTSGFLYDALQNGVMVISAGTAGRNPAYVGAGLFRRESDPTYGSNFDAFWAHRCAYWAIQSIKSRSSTLNLNASEIYVDGDLSAADIALSVAYGPDRARSGSQQLQVSTRVAGVLATRLGGAWWPAFDLSLSNQLFAAAADPSSPALTYGSAIPTDLRFAGAISSMLLEDSVTRLLNGGVPAFIWSQAALGSSDFQTTQFSPALSNTLTNRTDQWHSQILFEQLVSLDSPFHTVESEFLVEASVAQGINETDTLVLADIQDSPLQQRKLSWILARIQSANQTLPEISYAPNTITLIQDQVIAPIIEPYVTGTPPFSFTLSPALPEGVFFNVNSASISGAPSSPKPAVEHTATVINPFGQNSTSLTIGVNPKSPANLDYPQDSYQFVVGAPISPISPTVDNQVDSFSINTAPPPGIIFSPAFGRFTGTALSIFSPAPITVTALNVTGQDSDTLTFSVVSEAPSSPTYPSSDYNLFLGDTLSPQVPTLVSGTADLWSVSPALPASLSFTSSNGEFGGSLTEISSDDTYTVTSRNTATDQFDTTTFTLEILSPVDSPLNLSYGDNYFAFQVGSTITPIAPTVDGVVDFFTVSPPFPTGVSFSAATGLLSGEPSLAASPALHVVKAHNSAGFTAISLGVTVVPANPVLVTPSFSGLNYVPTDFGGAQTSFGQFNVWIPPTPLTGGAYPVLITSLAESYSPLSAQTALNSSIHTLEYLAYISGVVVVSLDIVGNSTQFTGSGCFRDPDSAIEGPQYDDLSLGFHFPERYFAFGVQRIKDLIDSGALVADPNNIVVKGSGSGASIAAFSALHSDRAFASGSSQIQQSTKVKGIIAERPILDYSAMSLTVTPQPLDVGHWANPEGSSTNSTDLGQIGSARLRSGSISKYILETGSYSDQTATLILGDSSLGSTDFSFSGDGYPNLQNSLTGSPQDLWHAYMMKRMLDAQEPTFHGVNTFLLVDSDVAQGHGEDATFSGGVRGFEAQSMEFQWLLNLYFGTLDGSESPPINLTYSPGSPYSFIVGQQIPTLAPSNDGGTIIQYSVSPALPTALSLNMFSGEIDGTIGSVTAGSDHRITGLNAGGSDFIDLTFNATSPPPSSPLNLSYTPAGPYVFEQFSTISPLIPSYNGGSPSVVFSVSPLLPSGIVLNLSGIITGAAQVELSPTDFEVKIENSAGFDTEILNISVNAASSPPSSTGPEWGANFQPPWYSERVTPFSDLMKQSFLWLQQGTGNIVVTEIADGQVGARYPDPTNTQGGLAHTLLLGDHGVGAIPSGTMRLVWLGTSATAVSLSGSVVTSQIGSGSTGYWYYRDYQIDGNSGDAISLFINENDVNSPVRDIHVWLPGQPFPESPNDAHPPVFNPDWEALHAIHQNGSGFPSLIRFLNWTDVNRYGRVGGGNQPPPPTPITTGGPWASPTSYSWGRDEGTPYEVMVYLANRWQAEPWLTLVHRGRGDGVDILSSPDYITYIERTADIILNGRVDSSGVSWSGLDPSLEYTLEWANETWNSGFPVTSWLSQKGATPQERAQVQAREMEMVYTAWENIATPQQLSRMKFFVGGTNSDPAFLSRVFNQLSPSFQQNIVTAGGPPAYWLPNSSVTGSGPGGYLENLGSPGSPVFPNLPVDAAQVIADSEGALPQLHSVILGQAQFMRSQNKECWVYEHNYGLIPTGPPGTPPNGWVGLAWQSHVHPDLFQAQRNAMQTLIMDTGVTRCAIFTTEAAKIEFNQNGHWGPYDTMDDTLTNVPVDPDNYIHEGYPKWSAQIAGTLGLTVPPNWPNV